jgi:hypothetical protein
MKDFIKKMLLDESDSPSTKRIIAMLGSVVLFITLFVNSFSEVSKAPSPELISGCVMIITVALGATSIDKFSKKA